MQYNVGVIGLGYVGLPLAIESGKHFPTVGFDISDKRIDELRKGYDRTLEVSDEELAASKQVTFTNGLADIAECNFYVVTVPTPIDDSKKPDLSPLIHASKALSSVLRKGDVVVYESTVFPGCTEEVCVPELERGSGLSYMEDFFCGYSPERINPGDKTHRLVNIKKVTSGCNPEIATWIDNYYATFVEAGTFKASSIRVAEAAKVIENSQRDINIAFVNELSLIFEKMNLDTLEVLEAAGTKWNFLPFKPGLVGGHCIGVDPYYLTHKAQQLGYNPEIILAGRSINDSMGGYVAQETVKFLVQRNKLDANTKIAVLGITFKENCPDIRNTRVIDIVRELQDFNLKVEVYDPNVDKVEVKEEYDLDLLSSFDPTHYKAIILAVAHEEFLQLDWKEIRKQVDVVYDIKGMLPKDLVTSRL